MVALFLFEFVEGNTVTRLYFMRLRHLTLKTGKFTPELEQARAEMFRHSPISTCPCSSSSWRWA
jgi:hypothetical protein